MYEQKTTWLLHYSVTRRGRTRQYGLSVEAETHQRARKIFLKKVLPGEIYKVISAECVLRVAQKR